ncbi:MAG: helix-turn-helix domain-containing protein [Elusimicrobiota bacterium]|jgi:transcriptional regulator with XRE-family HTH domain|nr:helix-turn-helix domain-containing protein [Elusimicrobiota bacterium]
MDLKDRLKFLRRDKLKLTQEKFAKKINLTQSNYHNLERGRYNITNRVINDIAREYKVNKIWLLEGKGDIFEKKIDETVLEIMNIYDKMDDIEKKYLYGIAEKLLEIRLKHNKETLQKARKNRGKK